MVIILCILIYLKYTHCHTLNQNCLTKSAILGLLSGSLSVHLLDHSPRDFLQGSLQVTTATLVDSKVCWSMTLPMHISNRRTPKLYTSILGPCCLGSTASGAAYATQPGPTVPSLARKLAEPKSQSQMWMKSSNNVHAVTINLML